MIGYVKYFDNSKTVSFETIDNKIFKKYIKILKRVRNLMNIEFDSEPVYSNKYIKAKIKIYKDKVNTIFQGKKVHKENTSCKCLSLIILGSFIRLNKKYYPQTLLEERKYETKETKMESLINDDLNLSSFDESENEIDTNLINNLLKVKTVF